MYRAYKCLFYKFYCWQNKHWADNSPEITAFLLIGVFIGINIISIISALDVLFDVRVKLPNLSRLEFIGLYVVFTLPQYFMFISNNKYKKILKEFSNLTEKENKQANLWTVIYILTSIGLLIFIVIKGSLKYN